MSVEQTSEKIQKNRQERRFLTVHFFAYPGLGIIRVKSSADELAKDVVAVRKSSIA